ncbi:hypothetical protein WMW72_14970 [Paenibacillus filicis]|uniref:Thioredoxin domain-containing protein n=1 Tax=Paenibacillus filicis TaxID=669464 RepID=A0ABU9DK37_9BACL
MRKLSEVREAQKLTKMPRRRKTQEMSRPVNKERRASVELAPPPGISSKARWLLIGSLTLLLLLAAGLAIWSLPEEASTSSSTSAEQQPASPTEITGSSKEAVGKLKALIDGEESSFVYYYKPDCEPCRREEPILFLAAEEKGLTVHRFNLAEYGAAMKLRNGKGLPLVDFYKELPAVAYYNKGWLIAWTEGEQPKSVYDQFYEHFRFGDQHEGHSHEQH